jgi:hypothetical protein
VRPTGRVQRFIAVGLAGGAVFGGLLASCAVYGPSLLLPATDGGDAASEANTLDPGAADGAVDPCAHVSPPPPPMTEDGTGDVDFVVAVSYLRLLPNGTATVNHPHPPTGFDLDHACTCPGPGSCKPRGAMQQCDADGGADEAANAIFQTFSLLNAAFTDDGLNQSIRKGLYTLLFRVKSYNGGRNDQQVSFIVYISNGINRVDGGAPAPRYDGTDVWSIDPSSLLGGATVDGGASCEGNDGVCVPFFADTQAYVADGILVTHIDFPILFSAGTTNIPVTLSGTELAAPLVFDGTSYRIDEGQLGGRWNTGGLLTAMGGAEDPLSPGQNLCGDSGTYRNIKSTVCGSADIMASSANDGTGATCDALSLAVSFSASQAHLGAIFANPPAPQLCGTDYKDDCP